MLLTRETGPVSDLSQVPTELEKPVSGGEKIDRSQEETSPRGRQVCHEPLETK